MKATDWAEDISHRICLLDTCPQQPGKGNPGYQRTVPMRPEYKAQTSSSNQVSCLKSQFLRTPAWEMHPVHMDQNTLPGARLCCGEPINIGHPVASYRRLQASIPTLHTEKALCSIKRFVALPEGEPAQIISGCAQENQPITTMLKSTTAVSLSENSTFWSPENQLAYAGHVVGAP